MSHPQRIGDILVASGCIKRDTMEFHAAKARGPLGEFLRAHHAIAPRDLARALAQQQHTAYIDFTNQPPDFSLFRPHDMLIYQAWQFVPYSETTDLLVIATCAPTSALLAWATAHYRKSVRMVVTGNRDLAHYFANTGATTATRLAKIHVRRRFRTLIADRVLTRTQQVGLALLMTLVLFGFMLDAATSWRALLLGCNLFYLTTLAVKWQLFVQGRAAHAEHLLLEKSLTATAATLVEETLPIYSILVPMYQESSAVIARLISSLNALDYPREKLDIKLVVEADDVATLAALKALRPPTCMEIIAVPPSHPRTKPKACNVALPSIRGEYLVIYDAEDAPATDQLRKAVALFRQSSEKTACVQAPLNYYNRDENLLTQLFAIEYSALFTLLLPALERMQLPIPLGGTSNHLRVDVLREIGGWDAFNVTEDADLGIRLSYLGYATRILPSLTLEEAPVRLGPWLKQRTRWIKGYIQTWLVYTRNTAELKRRLGRKGYYGFQFFVGTPALTFLLAPLFWGVFIVSLTGVFPINLSPLMLTCCIISFVSGMVSNWLFARTVMAQQGWHHLTRAGLLYPFYWLLHSIAAGRALAQLAYAPHYWEKTRHGVSKLLAKS